MTVDEEDRIRRAEEIQRYTENRCEALEKENAELKKQIILIESVSDANADLIQKMKCCGNCKYRIKKNLEGKIWVELCEKSYIKNKCEEWELTE